MFSLLSAEKDLEEDSLKRIIKFLAGFIEKVCPIMSGCARRDTLIF
jgi:hypothetical protein